MARCGCGGECGCNVLAGDGILITGTGSPVLPWTISAVTNCEQVRLCLSARDGITYNATTGQFRSYISEQAGNNLSLDADGGLYVGPPSCDVIRPCLSGVSGVSYNPATGAISADVSGTAGNALTVDGDGLFVAPGSPNVSAWNFPGTADAGGSLIYTDSTGKLRGEPPYHSYYFQSLQDQTFANVAVPGGADNIVHTFSFVVTNPDTYRSMMVVQWRDLDVVFNLPAGASAESGISTDAMYKMENRGSAQMNNVHTQVGKVTQPVATLAPGASTTLTLEAALGRGFNGATYSSIGGTFRVWLMPV